jgi:hypothetical protein
MNKHKHADLIHAWADGAQIQWNDPNYEEPWTDIRVPSWCEDFEYRIKPEPIPDIVKVFYLESNSLVGLRFSESFVNIDTRGKNRIRCAFDGVTGQLKSAEVL